MNAVFFVSKIFHLLQVTGFFPNAAAQLYTSSHFEFKSCSFRSTLYCCDYCTELPKPLHLTAGSDAEHVVSVDS